MSSWIKRALVTGGASGIGEAAARLFAARGMHVLLADVNAERGAVIAMDIRKEGGRADFHPVDVADAGAVDQLARTVHHQGPLDILVNAAGILQNATRLHDMDMDEYDRILAINLRGTVLVCRAFGVPMCVRRRGAIVNLCSLTSYLASPQLAYGLSKAALKVFTESLAAEYGPAGVRVNAVAPGYTLTPAMRHRIESGARDPAQMIRQAALRRLVEPSDIAEAIGFLASDAASAITGVTLPVDCGFMVSSAYQAFAAQP